MPANFNSVQLMGRLCFDPSEKPLEEGKKLVGFRMAINHKYKQKGEWKQTTCFVEVKAWDNLAETCKNLRKGSLVFLEGYLKNREFSEDGKKKTILEVTARQVKFLDQMEKIEPGDDFLE